MVKREIEGCKNANPRYREQEDWNKVRKSQLDTDYYNYEDILILVNKNIQK